MNANDLLIGLIGDDHVLSLLNIQSDMELRQKFQAIAPEEWAEVITFKIKNYSVVGDCTNDLLDKLKGSLIEHVSALDYAIIIIGTNDVLLGTPISDTVHNMQELLLLLLEMDLTPVFCTLMPISREEYSQKVADINSIMTIFTAKHGIQVVDLNVVFNDGEDAIEKYYDIGDGIHLTQEGYLFLADNLLLRVQEIIIKEFNDYQKQQLGES
ncbi:MAG: SGNH/GDSL hydrolase family protein [Candidatus Hodarchaeota archaeon]